MKVNCVVLFPNQGTCHEEENSVILKLQHKLERENMFSLGNYLPKDVVRPRLGENSKATWLFYKHNNPQWYVFRVDIKIVPL